MVPRGRKSTQPTPAPARPRAFRGRLSAWRSCARGFRERATTQAQFSPFRMRPEIAPDRVLLVEQPRVARSSSRTQRLRRPLFDDVSMFDYQHAIEIQGVGNIMGDAEQG